MQTQRVKITGIVIIIMFLTGSIMAADWPMFHNDPARTGYTPDKISLPLSLAWSYSTGRAILSSPAVVNNLVYFADTVGYWYARNATTGDSVWCNLDGGGGLHINWSSTAVDGGYAYIGTYGGGAPRAFVSRNATTGSWHWGYYETVGTGFMSSPVVSGNKVYIIKVTESTWCDKVVCVNADNGSEIWAFPGGTSDFDMSWTSPAYYNGKVYIRVVGPAAERGVYCLDGNTGSQSWFKNLSDGCILTSPAIVNDKLYVGGGAGLHAINALTGSTLWDYVTPQQVTSTPAIASGKVYFGCDDKYIYCLDASNGSFKWKYQTGGSVVSSPAVADTIVLCGSDDGKVYAFGANSGTLLWSYTIGSPIKASIAVANGMVYVGAMNGNLYTFKSTANADVEVSNIFFREKVRVSYPKIDREFIGAYIKNNGPDTARNVEAKFYVNTILLGADTLQYLANQHDTILNFPWVLTNNALENQNVMVTVSGNYSDNALGNDTLTKTISIYYVKSSHTGVPFKLDYDAFSFQNWAWGWDQFLQAYYNYFVNARLWDDLIVGLVCPYFILAGIGTTNAHCLGMANAAALYFKDPSQKPKSTDIVYNYTQSEIQDKIDKYHIIAFPYNLWVLAFPFAANIACDSIKKIILENTSPILAFGYTTSSSVLPKGHSMNVYKLIEMDSIGVAYLYDNMNPYEDSLIVDHTYLTIFDKKNDEPFIHNSVNNPTFNITEEDGYQYSSDKGTFPFGFPYSFENYSDGKKLNYTFGIFRPVCSVLDISEDFLWTVYNGLLQHFTSQGIFLIGVFCPVEGLIKDEMGRRIGYINGQPVNEIPNAEMVGAAGALQVFAVPKNHTYSLSITGQDTISNTDSMDVVMAVSKDSSARNVNFLNVQLKSHSFFSTGFSDTTKIYKLLSDKNGDGTFEDTILPSVDTIFGPQNVAEKKLNLPLTLTIKNYPNPFETKANIEYQFPNESRVILKIYNSAGQQIRILVNEIQKPGIHKVFWDGRDDFGKVISNGIYFYSLQAGNSRCIRKAVLLR